MVPKVLAAVLILLVLIVLGVQIAKKPADETTSPPTVDAVVTPEPTRTRVTFDAPLPLTPPPDDAILDVPALVSTPVSMDEFYTRLDPDPARYSTWTLENYTPTVELTPPNYTPPEGYEPKDFDLSITPPPYNPADNTPVPPAVSKEVLQKNLDTIKRSLEAAKKKKAESAQ
jgi:hypothetical protein